MYDSCDIFDEVEREAKTLMSIGYAKSLYDAQVSKVKREEYIKNLLLEDYVTCIKQHRSRYDYINIFSKAQAEISKKLKKDRPHFETIKTFIMEEM